MQTMFAVVVLVVLLFSPAQASAQTGEDEVRARLVEWEKAALECQAGSIRFPSKQKADLKQPCNDGDMTLFNGLLCAAGDQRGCTGVREAQDPKSGLWHRSPRIRLLGKNDEGPADSSPDMALGTQLYLIVSQDRDRAEKWLAWIHQNTPCVIKSDDGCFLHGIPQFCSTPDCIIRPQDAATLAATVSFLQKYTGMPALPDGRLRGMLGTFSGYDAMAQEVAALVNDRGFPQHLVGVSIWTMRLLGSNDPRLQQAAQTLVSRNPGNAFFSFLAGVPKSQVVAETLARCPANPATLVRPLHQWQWERDNKPDSSGLYAWQQSALWDCIFMARLVGKM